MKRSVNLTEFAASRGYELDRKASSRSSVIMVHPDGDKIVIARARHDLVADLGPITRDLIAVRAAYEDMRPLGGYHRYLVEERSLPIAVLADPRFRDRMRVDARGNAVFPHFNRDGISGFEAVNTRFKSFSKGGAKSLWASSIRPDDQALVIAESAIDALSYAALHGSAGARFASLAGQVSPEQVELVAAAIGKLPGGTVVLAFDNDEAGDRLTARFEGVFAEVGRADLALRVHRPDARGADWNDELRGRGRERLDRHHSPPPPELAR